MHLKLKGVDLRTHLTHRTRLLAALLAVQVCGCSAQLSRISGVTPTRELLDVEPAGSLELVTVPVAPSDPRIGRDRSGGDPALVAYMDGKPFFGTDGGVPYREIVSATLALSDGRRIELNVDGLFDPGYDLGYNPSFRIEKHAYLTFKASLGCHAGSYYVEWEIGQTGSVRTLVDRHPGVLGAP